MFTSPIIFHHLCHTITTFFVTFLWTKMSTITYFQAWLLTWKVVNRFISVTSSVTFVPTRQFGCTWLNTTAIWNFHKILRSRHFGDRCWIVAFLIISFHKPSVPLLSISKFPITYIPSFALDKETQILKGSAR